MYQYQAVIKDRLLENSRRTKPCKTERQAEEEGRRKIKRLCDIYGIETKDDRFVIECIEIK